MVERDSLHVWRLLAHKLKQSNSISRNWKSAFSIYSSQCISVICLAIDYMHYKSLFIPLNIFQCTVHRLSSDTPGSEGLFLLAICISSTRFQLLCFRTCACSNCSRKKRKRSLQLLLSAYIGYTLNVKD